MTRSKLLVFASVLVILVVLIVFSFPYLKILSEIVERKMSGKKTVSDRLSEFGSIVDDRLSPFFKRKSIQYPPGEIVLIALKKEKVLEVYANNPGESFKKICSYPILAASGRLGPKLKEGDRQVPEGVYKIESLNPNSLFHLSMKVDYPNEFDKKKAQIDNRINLGGDIMIHGNQLSIGCIAVGDQASEDLFVLVSKTGHEKVKVIISPVDFRTKELPEKIVDSKTWTNELYEIIKKELRMYQKEI